MLRRNLISHVQPSALHIGELNATSVRRLRGFLWGIGAGSSARHHTTNSTFSTSTAGGPATMPHQCSIEQVLLVEPQASGCGSRTDTLKGVVQLLIDPDADDVEDVSMIDFVAMVPRRQLAALRGRREWLDVVLGSERYQACRDARALRLAGITTVGRWDENRDRVPLSMYTRGVLEEAYAAMARHPAESQKDQIITWLTKAIQAAVIEEFVTNTSNRKVLAPLITGMQVALPVAEAAAETEAEKEGHGGLQADLRPSAAKAENEVDSGNKLIKASKGRGRKNTRHAETQGEDCVDYGEGGTDHTDAASGKAKIGTKNTEEMDDTAQGDEDAEIERLLEETEQELSPAPYVRGNKNVSGSPPASEEKVDTVDAKSTKAKGRRKVIEDNASKGGRHPTNDKEEQRGRTGAGNYPSFAASPNRREDESLARLTALMLHQFGSPDGYLHLSDIREDEEKGFVTPLDDGLAQVDPFALYSAFSSTTPSRNDSPEIAALKHVWASYNSYTEAREAPSADAASIRFYKEKGVEALVHAAVLLRAISRGHAVTVNARDIPAYGFPLISSDRRPYRLRRGKGVTDMTSTDVADAVKAFKAFFANRKYRFTPFRPPIDFNSGCSVIALIGSTLHLYETSLKSAVREEDIRCRFAEAMLGILHALDQQIITRVDSVHYHILATSIGGGGAGYGRTNFSSNANTSIVSIDTEGPFTATEKRRLQQLAEPLGLANAIAQCASVSSLVEAIGMFNVSVTHDILSHRDELEALLTPTLVQLLPEAGDDDDFDETCLEKPPSQREGASRQTNVRAGNSGFQRAAAKAAEMSEEEECEDDLEEQRVEVRQTRGSRQKSPSSRSVPAKTVEVQEEDVEEEVEEDEEDEGAAYESEEEKVDEEAEFEVVTRKPQTQRTNVSDRRNSTPPGGRGTRGYSVPPREDHRSTVASGDKEEEEADPRAAPIVRGSYNNARRNAPPVESSSQDPLSAGARRGYITRKPPPPAVQSKQYHSNEGENLTVQHPARKPLPMRRAAAAPQRQEAHLRPRVSMTDGGSGAEEEEGEEVTVTHRPRTRGAAGVGVRRPQRVPIQNDTDIVGDRERWFDR